MLIARCLRPQLAWVPGSSTLIRNWWTLTHPARHTHNWVKPFLPSLLARNVMGTHTHPKSLPVANAEPTHAYLISFFFFFFFNRSGHSKWSSPSSWEIQHLVVCAPGSSSNMLSLQLAFAMEHNNLPTKSWECFVQCWCADEIKQFH